jgi:hypothetical protein
VRRVSAYIMPVFPPGVPTFTILPPCTSGDTGAPSYSLSNDLDRVFMLIEDERHLTAHALLESVRERLLCWEALLQESQGSEKSNLPRKNNRMSKKEKEILAAKEKKDAEELKGIKDKLSLKQAVIDKLEVRTQRQCIFAPVFWYAALTAVLLR